MRAERQCAEEGKGGDKSAAFGGEHTAIPAMTTVPGALDEEPRSLGHEVGCRAGVSEAAVDAVEQVEVHAL